MLKDYIQDLKTGFMTPGPAFVSTIRDAGVTVQQKVDFLEAFKKTFNFSKAAKLVGCTRSELTAQFEGDVEFYKAYRRAVESVCDQAESNLLDLSKRNPTACFGILKAYRPGIWGDKKDSGNAGKSEDKLKGLLDEMKKDGKLLDVKESDNAGRE